MNIKSKRRAKLIRKDAKKTGRTTAQLIAENGARINDGTHENPAFRYCGI